MFSCACCSSCSTNFSGSGMSIASTSASTALSLACVALLELLDPLKLLAGVFLQLVEGVELACELGEVVVELGQLLDLDGLHGHRDVGLLALGLAAGQLALERRRLAGGQAGERIVQAVEHRRRCRSRRTGRSPGRPRRVRRPRSRTGRSSCSRRSSAGRCAVLRLAKRSRRLFRYSSMSSSVTSALSTVTLSVDEVGELELGPDLDLGRERELLAVVELRDLHFRLAEGEHRRPPARPCCRTRAARRSPPRSAPRRGRSACR